MGFNLIYWTPKSGSYFLKHSILEKCGHFCKNVRFSGRIWPDWGNTAWADMAGLGSIGAMKSIIVNVNIFTSKYLCNFDKMGK